MSALCFEEPVDRFRLTEGIEVASPVWIGVITTLMIERMPLRSTDELTVGEVHLFGCFGKRKSLEKHRTLAPRAAGTVQIVVSIPVVDILAERVKIHCFGRSAFSSSPGHPYTTS